MESGRKMKGRITQWKDDKGFGFITSEDGQNVFSIFLVLLRKVEDQKLETQLYILQKLIVKID